MTRRAQPDVAATGGRDTPLREQILDAARALTVGSGWSSVTMGRVADLVGVSRQTVYTEVGAKPDLASALVLDELARFLGLVEAAFDAHPDDAVEAIRAAVGAVLRRAGHSPLLRAIVSASQGADTELLPLLTTNAERLLADARRVVAVRLAPATPDLTARERETVVDVVVRVVLGHVMAPDGPPGRTADDLAWVVARLLGRSGA